MRDHSFKVFRSEVIFYFRRFPLRRLPVGAVQQPERGGDPDPQIVGGAYREHQRGDGLPRVLPGKSSKVDFVGLFDLVGQSAISARMSVNDRRWSADPPDASEEVTPRARLCLWRRSTSSRMTPVYWPLRLV